MSVFDIKSVFTSIVSLTGEIDTGLASVRPSMTGSCMYPIDRVPEVLPIAVVPNHYLRSGFWDIQVLTPRFGNST